MCHITGLLRRVLGYSVTIPHLFHLVRTLSVWGQVFILRFCSFFPSKSVFYCNLVMWTKDKLLLCLTYFFFDRHILFKICYHWPGIHCSSGRCISHDLRLFWNSDKDAVVAWMLFTWSNLIRRFYLRLENRWVLVTSLSTDAL